MKKIYEYDYIQLWVHEDMEEKAIMVDTFSGKVETLEDAKNGDRDFFEKVVGLIVEEYGVVSVEEIATQLALCIVDEDYSEALYGWIEDEGIEYSLECLN